MLIIFMIAIIDVVLQSETELVAWTQVENPVWFMILMVLEARW